MMAYIADVSGFEQQVIGDFVLDVQVVLIRDRRRAIGLEKAHSGVGALTWGGRAETRVKRRPLEGRKAITQPEDTEQIGLRDHEAGRCRKTRCGDVSDRVTDRGPVEHPGSAT